jgi:hypothetical protein
MHFLRSAFQQVHVPTAWDEEGLPTAFDPRLHVNIPLGFTGDPRTPHYVEGSTLILPDGTPGPDLSAFMVAPEPTSPLAVFCGVETLFLRDTDTPALAAALAAWGVDDEGD